MQKSNSCNKVSLYCILITFILLNFSMYAQAETWTHDRGGPGNQHASGEGSISPPYRTKWINGYAQKGTSSGMVCDGNVLYEFKNSDIIAFDTSTGAILWEVTITGRLSSGENEVAQNTVAIPGKLYVLTAAACLELDAATGNTLKTYPGPGGAWEYVSYESGILYGCVNQDTICAINADTEIIEWTHVAPGEIKEDTIAVGDGRVYYYSPLNGVKAVLCSDGSEAWTNAAAAVPDYDRPDGMTGLYSSSYYLLTNRAKNGNGGNGATVVLHAATGIEAWSNSSYGCQLSPSVVNNKLYMAATHQVSWKGSPGSVDVFDLTNGTVLPSITPPFHTLDGRCGNPIFTTDIMFYCDRSVTAYNFVTDEIYTYTAFRSHCNMVAMPSDGFIYIFPNRCKCSLTIKATVCLEPDPGWSPGPVPILPARLITGTASAVGGARPVTEWPVHRYDMQHRGATPSSLNFPLSHDWTFSAPGSLTSPTVGHDLAFVGCSDSKVYAIDVSSGTQTWSFTTGGIVPVAPTVWGDQVYFGSEDGWVYCVKATNGELVWKFDAAPENYTMVYYGRVTSVWPVLSGILVDNGTAYFCAGLSSGDGTHIYALDALDGSVVWYNGSAGNMNDAGDGLCPNGPMAADANNIYIATDADIPAAFSRTDGSLVWWRYADSSGTPRWRGHVEADHITGGMSLAVFDDIIYTGGYRVHQATAGYSFHALDPATGVLIARPWGYINSAPIEDAANIYCLRGSKSLPDVGLQCAPKQTIRDQVVDPLPRSWTAYSDDFDAAVLWTRASYGNSGRKYSLVMADDILIGGYDKPGSFYYLYAVDTSGTDVWSDTTTNCQVQPEGLAVAYGRLFASTVLDKLECFIGSGPLPLSASIDTPASSPHIVSTGDGTTVLFEGSASDGTLPYIFDWDYDYSGSFVSNYTGWSGTSFPYTVGSYTAALQVTDDEPSTDIDTITIIVYDNGGTPGVYTDDSDWDIDGLPDGWEIDYFNDFDEIGTGDPDGDGYDNATEYAGGTDPTVPNDPLTASITAPSDPVIDSTGSADVSFTGSASNGVPFYQYDWDYEYFGVFESDDTIQNGNYTYANGVYIAALQVTDGNLDTDMDTVTIMVYDDGGTPGVYTDDSDWDIDGLSDAWEMDYFSDFDEIGTDDPDGDGYDNATEYAGDTNPTVYTDPVAASITAPAGTVINSTGSADVSFTGSASNGVPFYVFDWDYEYSGAFVSNESVQNGNYTYNTNGAYTAALQVTDSGSVTDLAAVMILVYNDNGTPGNYSDDSDWDIDGLPDGWEIDYFSDFDETGTDDPDGDTYDNATEYDNGTDPTVYNTPVTAIITAPSDTVISSTGSADVSFTGSASDGLPPYTFDWDYEYSGVFESNQTIQDGNYIYSNGVYTAALQVTDSALSTDVATITIIIYDDGGTPTDYDDDSDWDEDGLQDGWEMYWFGNFDETGTGDFDGDDYDNATEYSNNTDPTVQDPPPTSSSGTKSGCMVGTPTGLWGLLAVFAVCLLLRLRFSACIKEQ